MSYKKGVKNGKEKRIAHVANSASTVRGDSYSAGRMYDLFGKKAKGKVKYVLDYGAICVLKL